MMREMFRRHIPPVKPFVHRHLSVPEGDVGDVWCKKHALTNLARARFLLTHHSTYANGFSVG